MAIKIRNYVGRNFGVDVALIDISKAGTVRGLSHLVIERLKAKYRESQGDEAADTTEDNKRRSSKDNSKWWCK